MMIIVSQESNLKNKFYIITSFKKMLIHNNKNRITIINKILLIQ